MGQQPDLKLDGLDDQTIQHAVLLMDAYAAKKKVFDQDLMLIVGKVALYMACKLVHAANFEQKYSFEYFEEVLN